MLSEFLRTTVYGSSDEVIELERELQFLRLYLDIEKAAQGEAITVVEKHNADTRCALIPNFIIQPIVESFLYELGSKENLNFTLRLETDIVGVNLKIILDLELSGVTNIDVSIITRLSAVETVRERLLQLYSENQKFEINRQENNKFRIFILLPHKDNFEESASELLTEN
jgi:LytS/YehU family sensor histidine kinase